MALSTCGQSRTVNRREPSPYASLSPVHHSYQRTKPSLSIQGHKDAVFRLAVLPDGVLVSASWDSAIKLWDPYSGTCLATLTGHRVCSPLPFAPSASTIIPLCEQGKVRALAVLPDGRIASAGDDQVIRIWEGEANRGDMRCIKQLQGHTKAIESLAVLLDGMHTFVHPFFVVVNSAHRMRT